MNCPRCLYDVDVDWSPGDCPICGLHYETDQMGETWSGDEYPIPVWDKHEAMTLEQVADLYNDYIDKMTDAMKPVIQMKRMICAAKYLLLAAKGPDGGPTDWNETRQRWLEYAKDFES